MFKPVIETQLLGPHLLVAIIILSGIVYSIQSKKLTVAASFTGGIMALIIFFAAGLTGVMMMAVFFLLGSFASSWKGEMKRRFAAPLENSEGRRASQVLANAGVSTLVALLIFIFPERNELLLPLMGATFASATADTLSSELGMVYGRRFFNISTFKADQCGMDGVISLEGTLIGVLGSTIMALVYALGFGFSSDILMIIIAATVGNLMDSFLGAVFERKGLIGNDLVNFLSTLSASLVAWLLLGLF